MVQSLKQKWKEQKGFTLIELLAVIVILGIIAAIAIPSVMKIIDNSRRDSFIADAQQLVNSAKTAASDTNLVATEAPQYLTLNYLQDKQYVDLNKDPDGGDFKAGNATGVLTAAPTDASYVEISVDKTTGKMVYRVQLIGGKRKIDVVDPSKIERKSVIDITTTTTP